MNEEIADMFKKQLPATFTQLMADKGDYNPATFDFKGSRDVMGILSAITAQDTEGFAIPFTMPVVAKWKFRKVVDVTKNKIGLIMQFVNYEENWLSKKTFQEFPIL